MRIDSKSNVEGIYEKTMKKDITIADSSNKGNSINEEKKTSQDRIEISRNGSSFDELSSIKEKAVADIEKSTSPDKLRQLKAAIENGTYYVSSEDIAGAIVGSGSNNEME